MKLCAFSRVNITRANSDFILGKNKLCSDHRTASTSSLYTGSRGNICRVKHTHPVLLHRSAVASAFQFHDNIFPSAENKENTFEAFNNVDKRATFGPVAQCVEKLVSNASILWRSAAGAQWGKNKCQIYWHSIWIMDILIHHRVVLCCKKTAVWNIHHLIRRCSRTRRGLFMINM